MLEVRFEHSFPEALGAFSLKVNISSDARRLALFGPSGSGKTLTLQALAGLFLPRDGYMEVNGRVLFDSARKFSIPARKRKLGYLFQDYAIFPHLTVRQNIAFAFTGPFGGNIRKDRHKVEKMLEIFELQGLADSYPARISGGQKQRVALARALITEPDLLLLDEPFSALDPLLRARIRGQCAKILTQIGIPSVIITHDPEDVIEFADMVSFYEKGSNSPCENIGELAQIRSPKHATERRTLIQALQIRKFLQERAFMQDDAFTHSTLPQDS
jgi:molybdate transport system ATP-binding protein